MSLAAKLVMRQGQSMALTPQLLQAIKLLQLPSAELASFLNEELQSNPFLEVQTEPDDASSFGAPEDPPAGDDDGDWSSSTLVADQDEKGQEYTSEADDFLGSMPPAHAREGSEGGQFRADHWPGAQGEAEDPNREVALADSVTFAEHLRRQAAPMFSGPSEKIVLDVFIDALDEAGYLREPLETLADNLGLPLAEVERRLSQLQGLDPTGVFARDLAECLRLQLLEFDRLDPAMAVLVENLPLLADRDFDGLQKLCGVDAEDLAQMVDELRRLNPKPGLSYQGAEQPLAAPDVIVTAVHGDRWRVELNEDVLPRVVVNSCLVASVSRRSLRDNEKALVSSQLQSANWLVKSIEQRSRTILAVATEIVRRQDGFLSEGVRGLRPLTLKAVADAIGVHESTVSRAAADKTVQTPRGVFEMKRFFSNAVAAREGGEAHSSASVRHRIKSMIASENPAEALSDDAIVEKLSLAGIVVARRTVAKYREGMNIPSSVERRRMKHPIQPLSALAAVTLRTAASSREPSIDSRDART